MLEDKLEQVARAQYVSLDKRTVGNHSGANAKRCASFSFVFISDPNTCLLVP
jgi:hypothetical protein